MLEIAFEVIQSLMTGLIIISSFVIMVWYKDK